MIITLQGGLTPSTVEDIRSKLKSLGLTSTTVATQSGTYIVAPTTKEIDLRAVGAIPGVADARIVSHHTYLHAPNCYHDANVRGHSSAPLRNTSTSVSSTSSGKNGPSPNLSLMTWRLQKS